ncbi:HAAS signaling domain-containing protein [Sutcliffiella horikoshii]|uniref:HAAS signaling domain-containing protein n=1 Tax=Sutcliffiella horikoshii TaxID=79883 RepID=UPI001F48A34C|nr:hypothetical protein [Sutcliffiella horikoshii]MCG1023527.1 hypothetical protein [Sutcliffiella horikoshii]
MKLIELYVQEVTRRLPERQREDIGLELRSTIEDMLPDDYQEEDIKTVLSELGHPAKLASGYLDKPMHLIGPRYFDVYVSLLRLIIPLAMIISFCVVTFVGIFSYSGEGEVIPVLLGMIGDGVWNSISAGMQTFFWITLTFAIVERYDTSNKTNPITSNWKEWTPEDLKDVPYIPKERAITKVELFGSIIWTVIWVAGYFNANRLLGIYEKGEEGLTLVTPLFNQAQLISFWPLVMLVILLELGLVAYKWKLGQWTMKLVIANVGVHVVSLAVFLLVFSNLAVFNPAFFDYLQELFGFTHQLHHIFWVAVLIFLLSSISDIYQGVKKAKK